jgi:hypothetical protein
MMIEALYFGLLDAPCAGVAEAEAEVRLVEVSAGRVGNIVDIFIEPTRSLGRFATNRLYKIRNSTYGDGVHDLNFPIYDEYPVAVRKGKEGDALEDPFGSANYGDWQRQSVICFLTKTALTILLPPALRRRRWLMASEKTGTHTYSPLRQ